MSNEKGNKLPACAGKRVSTNRANSTILGQKRYKI